MDVQSLNNVDIVEIDFSKVTAWAKVMSSDLLNSFNDKISILIRSIEEQQELLQKAGQQREKMIHEICFQVPLEKDVSDDIESSLKAVHDKVKTDLNVVKQQLAEHQSSKLEYNSKVEAMTNSLKALQVQRCELVEENSSKDSEKYKLITKLMRVKYKTDHEKEIVGCKLLAVINFKEIR